MIRYGELVQYIKDNHINWNTDLFEVLRGFFEQYYSPTPPCFPDSSLSESIKPIQGTVTTPKAFKEPQNGEYTDQDLINLFNT